MDGVSKDVKFATFAIAIKLIQNMGKGVAKALGIDINQIDLETNQDETYENFKNLKLLTTELYDTILNRKNS